MAIVSAGQSSAPMAMLNQFQLIVQCTTKKTDQWQQKTSSRHKKSRRAGSLAVRTANPSLEEVLVCLNSYDSQGPRTASRRIATAVDGRKKRHAHGRQAAVPMARPVEPASVCGARRTVGLKLDLEELLADPRCFAPSRP